MTIDRGAEDMAPLTDEFAAGSVAWHRDRRGFATLRRSVTLFRGFLREPQDPDYFYRLLAADSAEQVGGYVDLRGRLLLDVGGGPGYFAAAFRRAGASYVGLDPAVGDFSASGDQAAGMLRASGTELPIRSGSVDVCASSNVLEHVVEPTRMLDEMVRVTRPGGIVFLSFTPWLSPWGGHETSPWHYLGGEWASRRYLRRHGREPKNRFRQSLFPISIGQVLAWARGHAGVEVIDHLPRYHPWWARWMTRVPGVREVASWNFVLVLRKSAP